MNYASFHENENKLLETFLFASFNEIERTKYYTSSIFEHLELIITPECNQKCEYCYITKYGKELFPLHRRADKPTTLQHLKMVMDYFTYEKKFIFKEYELYAGDLYTTGYLIEVLELLLPYFQHIMKKVPELPNFQETRIIIPTNLRFVENDEIVQRIYELVDEYTKINVVINFSWSHDGAYSTDLREKVELNEEYYKKAFAFVQKTGAGIHPMLCAAGASRAIANFNWWVEMYEKYFSSSLRDTAMHELGVGTTRDMESVIKGIFFPSLRCKAYTWQERINIWKGKAFSMQFPVVQDSINFNAFNEVSNVQIPIYFIAGKYDYTCCYDLQYEYYEYINAPKKEFYTFENSAHSPIFEEPDTSLVIIDKILQDDTKP